MWTRTLHLLLRGAGVQLQDRRCLFTLLVNGLGSCSLAGFTECLYGHGVAGQFRSPLQPGFPTWYLFTGVPSSSPGALSRRVWLSSSIWRNSWSFPSSRSFVVRFNVLGHEVYGDLHVCWLKRFLWDVVITAAVLDVALTGHGCSTSRWPLQSC